MLGGRACSWWVIGLSVLAPLAAGCGESKSGADDDSSQAGAEQGGSSGKGGGSSGGQGGSAASSSGGRGGSAGSDPSPGASYVTEIRTTALDKVDLLLMIDNSLSMGEKQRFLADAIPVLVSRLVTPSCLDASGAPTGAVADADGQCSAGTPEFAPIRDLHVGIITSSLGDHGSNDVCSEAQNQVNVANGSALSFYNDAAQLLPSVRPNANLESWNNSGFLVWDPRDQSKVSDPHPNLGASGKDPKAFAAALATQVRAAGEHGCAYEASLESWYRFLIDPEPVKTMSNNGSINVRGMTNEVVLEERAAFLRPDSLLAIVMTSDENDCSIIDEDGTQGWLVGYKGGVNALTWHMPRAGSACADPNSPCCRPCGSPPAAGCPASDSDPSCAPGNNLSTSEDALPLRCFHQLERFGVDLLYPTARYVEAIQSTFVTPRSGGGQVPNPLFAPAVGAVPRSPDEVILMGILGVPWQDISTEDSWDGRGLTYLSAQELNDRGRWAVILGDPAASPPVAPSDPLMIEAIDPRPTGAVHPLLQGVAIVAPTDDKRTNPINGHEQAPLASRDDLQFACIFALPEPLSAADCTNDADACACNADELDKHSPLCEGTTLTADGSQIAAQGYPSLRELEVLKNVGESGIVTSICPKNVEADGSPATDPDYGYNPAVAALVARMSLALRPKCLPRPLTASAGDSNRVPCTILEATDPADSGGACDCAASGRTDAPKTTATVATTFMHNQGECDGLGVPCASLCVCVVPQLDGDELAACQAGDADDGTTVGFCYIDPARGFGSDAAVAQCDANSRRKLRFMGDGVPAANATVLISCTAG